MNVHVPAGTIEQEFLDRADAASRHLAEAGRRFVPPPSNRKTMLVTPNGYVPAPPPPVPAPRPPRAIDIIAARRRRQSAEQRALKVLKLADEPQIEIEYTPLPAPLPEDIALVCHPFRWEHILRHVAAKHNLKLADLLSPRRSVPLVLARHEAMWRMKNETTLSFTQIGRRMGGRDHTTAIHACRKHQKRIDAGEA